MVVGPAGSGKTEMVRRSNVGFPPGLQDVLQGSGGTLNMHWWFTNHAVMLDTAGRMFMEEAGEGQNSEWREFLKLLRTSRPTCPINGLILVIPSESLLKDPAEKIERTAGAIARQLDVIQRVLEVRFPVTVIVTKCDKIVGFKEFFETVNDPTLQHQILGWSNPASLDDIFKPEDVGKYLEVVREKLTKRRAGLLQNPIHTTDPSARRTDEVDELFELPGNMMRIAPRLSQYLEKIFVAGAWSLKPLFLRGIYFTSSMREGEALDVALAQALGVDTESVGGGKEYDREKAYFLKDVFLGKVFKERGLVTRAAHVGKSVAARRRWIVGIAVLSSLLIGGSTLAFWWGYHGSFDKPSKTWETISRAIEAEAGEKDQQSLSLFAADKKDIRALQYLGAEKVSSAIQLPEDADGRDNTRRSFLLVASGEETKKISDPIVAKPALWFVGRTGESYHEAQVLAHRAIVESKLLNPLIAKVRLNLKTESEWGPEAVRSLAQMLRLTTLSEDKAAAKDRGVKKAVPDDSWSVVDVEPLLQYALGPANFAAAFPMKEKDPELARLKLAVVKAYPEGFPGQGDESKSGPTETLFTNNRKAWSEDIKDALRRMADRMSGKSPDKTGELGRFTSMLEALADFDKAESACYADKLSWLAADASGPGEATAKSTKADYDAFSKDYRAKVDELDKAKVKCIDAIGKYDAKDLGDLRKFLDESVRARMDKEIDETVKVLRDQLPEKADVAGKERLADIYKFFDETQDANIPTVMKKGLQDAASKVAAAIQPLQPLLINGHGESGDARLYEVLTGLHKLGVKTLDDGEREPKAPEGQQTISASYWQLKQSITKSLDDQLEQVNKRKQWNVGNELGTLHLTRSAKAVERVARIAQMRATYGVCSAAIGEPLWKDWESFADAVSKLPPETVGPADKDLMALATGKAKPPKIPLTPLEEVSAYKAKYLPESAVKLLSVWRELSALNKPAAPGMSGPIAASELGAKIGASWGGDAAVQKYVDKYAQEWMNVACEQAVPDARDFKTMKDGMKLIKGSEGQVTDMLIEVRDRAVSALEACSKAIGQEKVGKADSLGKARDQIVNDYVGTAKPKSFENLLKTWGKAFSGEADEVRTTLRNAVDQGTFKDDYAQNVGLPDENPNFIKYRDEFVKNALGAITRAGGSDAANAWQLLAATKGIPLASGDDSLAELTDQQIDSIRTAASKLGGAAATKRTAGRGDDIKDPDLKNKVREMCGEDFLSSPERQAWFASLQAILNASKPGTLTASIELINEPTDENVKRSSSGKYAGQTYSNAGLVTKNGEYLDPAQKLVNIRDGGKSVKVKLKLPSDESAEIWLFLQDPKKDPLPPPDAKIVLVPGRWGPMRSLLCPSGQAQKGEAGAYRVFVRTSDSAHFLQLSVTLDSGASKLPDLAEWPRADKWPPN
jgi:hypothetical protein